jgi:large subunit ribosomal protein L21
MYAVFEDGSRQYRVSEGETVRVDWRDLEEGSPIEFSRVLLYRNADETQIGQPVIDGMRVVGEVVGHPSVKLQIQHFRRRKNSRRLKGHRQHYLSVKVNHILAAGQPIPEKVEKAPAPAPASSEPATPEAATPEPATT